MVLFGPAPQNVSSVSFDAKTDECTSSNALIGRLILSLFL